MKTHSHTKSIASSLRIVLIGSLLFSLAGCGEKSDTKAEKTIASKSKTADDGKEKSDKKPAEENPPVEAGPKQPPKSDKKVEGDRASQVDVPGFLSAALDGMIDKVQHDLDAGVDVNATDEQQRTALLFAAFNGHTDVVKLLLENGAILSQRDAMGRTALMFAATGANHETVEVLLEAGAEVNAIDLDESFTALMHAAAEGQLKVVEVLLKHKADPTMADVDGDTASDFAAKNGHTEVVRLLLK